MTCKLPSKAISSLLIVLFFSFNITGCSVIKNWFTFTDFSKNPKLSYHLTTDEINHFGSKIKPILTTDAEFYYNLARHFQKKNQHEIAIEEFSKALKMDSKYYNAYNALGVSYDKIQKYDAAEAAYKAALKINPDLDYVYNNLGYSYMLRGNLEKALNAFDKAISLNRAKEIYNNNRSLVITKLGSKDTWRHIAAIPSSTLERTNTDLSSKNLPENPEFPGNVQKTKSEKTDNMPPLGSAKAKSYFSIQIGAFHDLKNAQTIYRDAIKSGYECPYILKVDRDDRKSYYKVLFGKYDDKVSAENIAQVTTDAHGKSAFPVIFTPSSCTDHYICGGKCPDTDIKKPIPNRAIGIEILNGNGINKMAKNMGKYLQSKGHRIIHLANASHFNYKNTIIYYRRGFYNSARDLQKEILASSESVRLVASDKIRNPIKLIVARDLIPFKEQFFGVVN